jgi:glucose/arabinose dehydrogenase
MDEVRNMREAHRTTGLRRSRVLSEWRRTIAIAALLALATACGNGDPAEATPTAESTPEPTATMEATVAATATLVVPSVSRDVEEDTPTPEPPRDPPSADNVSFAVAFPNLPAINRPVGMIEVPGEDQIMVISQDGQVFTFAKDQGASQLTVALDWRSRTSRAGNEEGLLGIALSPDFESDRYVYLYYSAQPGERRSVVSRFEVSGSGGALELDAGSELVIMEIPQPASNHNGGQIGFGPDEMLYIALGDGGGAGDPWGHGQNRGTLLGSILRIDVSGATASEPYVVPPDNPFVGDAGTRPEIWVYGMRNPWRFSFDRSTGALWVADVGQDAWEEVNKVEAGGNYGWNTMEGFACYQPANCDQSGLALPVVAYANAAGNCSITGGYVGHDPAAGVLRGYYVYGDFCSGAVWTIPADAEAGEQPDPITLRNSGPMIASFAQDLDGQIYMLSFDGLIYRVDG